MYPKRSSTTTHLVKNSVVWAVFTAKEKEVLDSTITSVCIINAVCWLLTRQTENVPKPDDDSMIYHPHHSHNAKPSNECDALAADTIYVTTKIENNICNTKSNK